MNPSTTPMAIYYIKVTTAEGRRVRHHALYLSGIEAVLQTLADWPDARAISAICVKRAA